MKEKIPQLTRDLISYGHIFYYSHDIEKYIENAITYIVTGIEQGDHILFIENNKIYPVIQNQLKHLLSIEQLSKIHYKNNFDFYFSKGTFHPITVLNFFLKTLEPYEEKSVSARIWGHVEWGDQKDIEREIASYENKINQILSSKGSIAVCAYDAKQVSESLKESLLKCHGFFMTDNEINKIGEMYE
ncbi:MEDS domain-containing protein [Domibacillus epiphyticus]|uniref:MEDS domain-containing protein n=1 Tax=Domibacillus epiphyticus TaxID=1714355 RepID=A0A1V2A5Y4_9BACI|nr:MEDS domain-containing protein [Domibacillus epiphyticus]OMP66340.1 hypothetical protein BTO28_12835 [Domibacillus epiphyticus]